MFGSDASIAADVLDELRTQIAAACRALAAAGLVSGTNGNVSARDGEAIAITATGAQLATLEREQVTVVDRSGRVLAGALAPTSELDLHLGIYDRYDPGAVVHTHAPWATAIGLVVDELPCVHYEMLALGGTVRVAPYRTFGSPELAAAVHEALEGRAAALMANHGAVVHAGDVGSAVRLCELLEWACALYWRAAQLGTPRTLDERERQAVIEAVVARNYGTTREL